MGIQPVVQNLLRPRTCYFQRQLLAKIWLLVGSKGEPWQTLLVIYSIAIPTPLLPYHPHYSLEHQMLVFLASLAARGGHVTQR